MYVTDGKCCLGNCIKVKKSQTGKIIGWLIIIVIVIFLIWFKIKYKTTKNKFSLINFFKKKK